MAALALVVVGDVLVRVEVTSPPQLWSSRKGYCRYDDQVWGSAIRAPSCTAVVPRCARQAGLAPRVVRCSRSPRTSAAAPWAATLPGLQQTVAARVGRPPRRPAPVWVRWSYPVWGTPRWKPRFVLTTW